jgi:hypothetical protein
MGRKRPRPPASKEQDSLPRRRTRTSPLRRQRGARSPSRTRDSAGEWHDGRALVSGSPRPTVSGVLAHLYASMRTVPALGSVVVQLLRVVLLRSLGGRAVIVPRVEAAATQWEPSKSAQVRRYDRQHRYSIYTDPRLLCPPPLLLFWVAPPKKQSSYVYSPRFFSIHVPSSFFHSPFGPNLVASSESALSAWRSEFSVDVSADDAELSASRAADVSAEEGGCEQVSY